MFFNKIANIKSRPKVVEVGDYVAYNIFVRILSKLFK